MKRTIAALFATGACAATLVLTGGAASAAHCTESGGSGNSDFGSHAKANGSGVHNEGDHKGWSSCNPNSANYAP